MMKKQSGGMAAALHKADLPRGFSFSASACGIRRGGGPDVALIVSERPATAAAVFTTNLVQAAPVVVSRLHLRRGARGMRAILVNSGNANCCTGEPGMRAARQTAAELARALGCKPEQVLVNSTGVIGVPLPAEKIFRAIPALAARRAGAAAAFATVTRAIMTTDTRAKWAAARFRAGGKTVRLLGCAKGAGMIHPNMATMLAFVLTDAAVAPAVLQRGLREVASRTFNCISVDGDTSTNDTLAVLANGASGVATLARHTSLATRRFTDALERVCRSLALQIVADGEGAARVVEIAIRGARSDADAKCIANTIATSPLVKTALAGADPNWGRILAAAGRSGVRFAPQRTRIWLAGVPVFGHGVPLPFDERRAHRVMLQKSYSIEMELGESHGRGQANVWTCDFTTEYVKVNASYRT
jgi:glutamate N-acetyltransferase/amino-acid N-acetyltransferase